MKGIPGNGRKSSQEIKLLVNKLSYYLFGLLVFSMPLGRKVFVPILLLWILAAISSYVILRDYNLLRLKGILILPVVFFIFHTGGLANSINLASAFSDLQLKASILLVPLLYPYHREIFISNQGRIMQYFLAGVNLAVIICFLCASWRSVSFSEGILVFDSVHPNGWDNYYYGKVFSLFLHPSYFAQYILLALLVLLSLAGNFSRSGYRRILLLSGSFVMMVLALIHLQARAGILGLIILAAGLIIYLVIYQKRARLFVFLFLALSVLSAFLILRNHRYLNTLESIVIMSRQGIPREVNTEENFLRIGIWESAWELIREKPVWGVGTGDIRDELVKLYNEKGMSVSAEERHNAHNQFLESWLGLGVFGLVLLIVLLLYPLLQAVKSGNWLLTGFLVLVSSGFLFESMLATIAGVVYFSVFYTHLVSSLPAKTYNTK